MYENRKPRNKFSIYLADETLAHLKATCEATGWNRSKVVSLAIGLYCRPMAERARAAFDAVGVKP